MTVHKWTVELWFDDDAIGSFNEEPILDEVQLQTWSDEVIRNYIIVEAMRDINAAASEGCYGIQALS